MKNQKIRMAKDGFPLELIDGRPITNFFRKLLLTSHWECKTCWYNREAQKNPTTSITITKNKSITN